MEEILQDLIKTTLERGPQNRQFYSNLSITKPIHDHAEIQSSLCEAMTFLLSRFKPGEGFQSKLYANRNCAIELSKIRKDIELPNSIKETLTSTLFLDLLCNSDDLNEGLISPDYNELISLPKEVQDNLQDFIVPTWGITTFNLFKQKEEESRECPISSSSPSSSPSSSLVLREDFDSGNDSPISMNSHSDSGPGPEGSVVLGPDIFPDDINTTALTLSVLLNQGVLQPKPAESVVRWIISNIFTPDYDDEEAESFRFPTMITTSENQNSSSKFNSDCDAVSVVNFLKLMYTLDISQEELTTAAEKFLVTTLRKTIASESKSKSNSNSTSTLAHLDLMNNELGNPSAIIISSVVNEEQKRRNEEEEDDRDEEAIHENPFRLQLQHHSPDSLLYFLSRILATEQSCKKCGSSSDGDINDDYNSASVVTAGGDARPYISQMRRCLVDLLDARLGSSVDTCDLAQRILAGVYLGLVLPSQNNRNNLRGQQQQPLQQQKHGNISTEKLLRINNLLQKEFELLVSLQDQRDGSWPPDSIIQVEFVRNDNDDSSLNRVDTGDGDDDVVVGYLGGKEISTVFAIKAISSFLTVKRHSSAEDLYDEDEDENEKDADWDVHHLY